jgi:hypothetical protein
MSQHLSREWSPRIGGLGGKDMFRGRIDAGNLARAAPEFGWHHVSTLVSEKDGLNVIGAVEIGDPVDMSRVAIEQIEAIVRHRTGPWRQAPGTGK